jgi:AraC-like DNA-binding protein
VTTRAETGAISAIDLNGQSGFLVNLPVLGTLDLRVPPLAGLLLCRSSDGSVRVVGMEPERSRGAARESGICDRNYGSELSDAILTGLGSALLSALERGTASKAVLIRYILDAMHEHLVRELVDAFDGQVDSRKGLATWQVHRAKEFMVAHVDDNICVADVAAECELSLSHFTRAFKRSAGQSPRRWLQLYRVQRAKELLLGGLPLCEIAGNCGFADQSHMTRVFARVTGIPPGAFRHQYRARALERRDL